VNGARESTKSRRLSDRQVVRIMAAMAAVVLLLALWATRTVNPLRGDSAEYLYFDPSRSVGYPAFLELVRLATGHVALAVPLQMVLLAGSFLLLGWSFHRLCGHPAFSLAFAAALLIQPGSWLVAAFIMTEALSTALVALWCAQLLRIIRAPSLGAVALAAISAMATAVRPPLVALFFGTALFVLVAGPARQRGKSLLIALAALVVAWAATPVAQFVIHGSAATTSPFARGVLQHTLYCAPHRVSNDPDSLLVEQDAAPVRHYIDAAPAGMREQLRREYSTPLRFGSIIPVLGRRHALDRRSQVDPYLARIAAERVRANPWCFAASAANEYARLAMFATDPTSEDARAINAYMRAHSPPEVPQIPVLPGDERMARAAAAEVHGKVSGLNPERQRLHVVGSIPLVALLPFRLLVASAALFGLLALAALPIRPRLAPSLRPLVPASAALGLAFHAAIAITALVEIGFYRYLVPLWPIVCTLLALAVVGGWWSRRAEAMDTADSVEVVP
jgi:hypothetical protein